MMSTIRALSIILLKLRCSFVQGLANQFERGWPLGNHRFLLICQDLLVVVQDLPMKKRHFV